MSTRSSLNQFGEEIREARDPRRPESPVLRLLRITEQGLVFESWRSFEVGIFIDLGMHFPGRKLRGGGRSFLSVEGFVVDCQAVGSGLRSEDCRYRVTVMFSDVEGGDLELLRELEERVAPRVEPQGVVSASRRELLMRRLEEVFGLN